MSAEANSSFSEDFRYYSANCNGFVDTSASKHVGAALIAPMVENKSSVYHASIVQSSCSKCTRSSLVSQQTTTTNGGEGYDWSAHSKQIKHNQTLMADVKGKESSEKTFSTSDEASTSSSDFVEDDDYRPEISSSILDRITIEPVPVSSEVSEAISSQSVISSSADS
ncbi:hypothetical protein L1987_18945 [Smallanthus sonchifolius]|uniref:Uncharacterized protein n=1 Tax=Smallanthus sonchifolius TaxID=185202 RepID=A0ACB9J4L0_9ASTR|nr:hypothetical protein L1987_18945 [Smallanthus sonchifolius]